jgi:hypothetical protein
MTLFTPLRLASGVVINNRIAKAAMEENMADADHAPSTELLTLYQAWAQGGAGGICRPGWFICIHTCAPFERAACDQARNLSRCRSSSSTTPAGPVIARASTITLPVIITPAPPCAQA